eukprot:gene12524-13707_t
MLSAVLPEDLLIEISSYIEENHQILFASVNKALSKQLLRKARTFLIDSENRLNEFFFSQSFHERIKRVIHHPYDQLNICVPPDFLPTFEGKEVLQGLSCNELLTCLELFISSQPLPFYNIRKISIIKEQIVQVDDTFATAMDRIIKANLGLEEMSLTNMDFTDLPALTGLKSLIVCETSLLTSNGLHISDYKNLQSLTLKNCSGIIDVGCLDGIPKLQLIECGGIRDITNLHHNHSIEIINCRMIDDYSKSFKFSKNISIDCSNSIFFVNLNFHLLTHVGVNHLILSAFPDTIIEIPPTVKTLSFDSLLEDKVYEIPAFLSNYPFIEKIFISLLEEVNTRRVKNTLHKQLKDSNFLMDMLPGSPPRIVLLRKNG